MCGWLKPMSPEFRWFINVMYCFHLKYNSISNPSPKKKKKKKSTAWICFRNFDINFEQLLTLNG